MCWSRGHVWITLSVGSLSHRDRDLHFTMEDCWQTRPCCPEMEGPTFPSLQGSWEWPGLSGCGVWCLSSRLSLWCWECSSLFVCLVYYFEEQRVLNFAEVHSIDFFCFDCYYGLYVWFQEEDLTTWPLFTSHDTLLQEHWSLSKSPTLKTAQRNAWKLYR